jgi:hypothetical protein
MLGINKLTSAKENKEEKKVDTSSGWKTITVPGDGTCGLHCLAIALMENIHEGKLILDGKNEFLLCFGRNILESKQAATQEEVRKWVKDNYLKRYQLDTYSRLSTKVLRALLGERICAQWITFLLPKIIEKIRVHYDNSQDEKATNSEDEKRTAREINFQAMLAASSLKIGKFGAQLICINKGNTYAKLAR